MAAVTQLLLETLKDLSNEELNKFKEFLHLIASQKKLKDMKWMSHRAKTAETADLMVQTYGQQSVELTSEVLEKMKRTDLMKRLSETSSGLKDDNPKIKIGAAVPHSHVKLPKPSVLMGTIFPVKAHCDVLIYKNNAEFLKLHVYVIPRDPGLRQAVDRRELSCRYNQILKPSPDRPLKMRERFILTADLDSAEIYPEKLKLRYESRNPNFFEVFIANPEKDFKLKITQENESQPVWTCVIRKDDYQSAGRIQEKYSVDEDLSALMKTATITTDRERLLKTLQDLEQEEFEEFKWFLQDSDMGASLPRIPAGRLEKRDMFDLVDVMLQTYGQQSVEVTKKVFRKINRNDLVQRLSSKEKHSVDEHGPAPLEREVTMTSVKEKLLETLEDLSHGELEHFKHVLQHSNMKKGLPRIPGHRMEMAGRVGLVDLMVEIYGQQSVEETREVLKEMNRSDLVQRLSDTSSGSKGPSRSLELEGCGSVMQDSSDWTKLEPEVNSTDADEAPTYSLQSEAGGFECCVSGLRWVCKEQVSFKYQFFSWEEHMERMESIKYMPAGPLIDIIVIAGKLHEVYLPHWICIVDNPEITDRFAVLHIDDCGDVVEKAAEVSPSHVKLSEPVFSPRAVLMKAGFPVKINCNVLIYYKPNTPFLKLHVYLIPLDPALQQTVDKKELSKGYKISDSKSRPDDYLKMHQGFTLTADIEEPKILPKKITLRYDGQDPNFYEVYVENPERNFHLILSQLYTNKGETRCKPVWACEIRKDDYQSSAHLEAVISHGAAAEPSTGLSSGATVRETGGQPSTQDSTDKKYSVDEDLSALMKTATITTDKERLLDMLQDLKQEEFKAFKSYLQDSDIGASLPRIPAGRLEKSDMFDLVDVMLQTYCQQSVEVTKKVFRKINRNDLVQRLSDTSSASKASGSSA